jgi:hypothetical protein
MQRMHEGTAPQAAGMIALARNPLRLTQMDRDHSPRVPPATPRRDGAPIKALRWLIRRLRQAFLTAGSPTSVPRAGTESNEEREGRPAPRPGGSMLRRME